MSEDPTPTERKRDAKLWNDEELEWESTLSDADQAIHADLLEKLAVVRRELQDTGMLS